MQASRKGFLFPGSICLVLIALITAYTGSPMPATSAQEPQNPPGPVVIGTAPAEPAALSPTPPKQPALAAVNTVYLPLVVQLPSLQGLPTATPTPQPTSTPTPQPTSVPTSTPTPQPTCQPNAQEARIAELMRTHPQQQRPELRCVPLLEELARQHATDMARRGYFSHVTPDGIGPNEMLRRGGYPLPAGYDQSLTANNVQSIGAGTPDPNTIWDLWMGSGSHNKHLLGAGDFWREQIDYGIGYVHDPNSPYISYWVVFTAYPETP